MNIFMYNYALLLFCDVKKRRHVEKVEKKTTKKKIKWVQNIATCLSD
jgi:hypothetical protein